jgi:hypothetical protein
MTGKSNCLDMPLIMLCNPKLQNDVFIKWAAAGKRQFSFLIKSCTGIKWVGGCRFALIRRRAQLASQLGPLNTMLCNELVGLYGSYFLFSLSRQLNPHFIIANRIAPFGHTYSGFSDSHQISTTNKQREYPTLYWWSRVHYCPSYSL